MDILFAILFLIAVLCFAVGLIYPKIFIKIFKNRTNRKVTSLVFAVAALVFLIPMMVLTAGTPIFDDIKSPTNQKNITIKGSGAYKNSQIKILLNGEERKELKADGSGEFSFEIELKEGENKLKASSTLKILPNLPALL